MEGRVLLLATISHSSGISMRSAPSRVVGMAVAAVVLMTAYSPSRSLACGYHDDVTMARGLLNWVYPDALHVLGAISTAVAERRLPNPDTAGLNLFGSEYRMAVKPLKRLAEALSAAAERPAPFPYSLVLVEPMLWTRFEAHLGELRTQIHVSGPQPGDLVLISGEGVIAEIANGRLDMGEAHRLGLVRMYGSEEQRAQFLTTYQHVGSESLAQSDGERVRDHQRGSRQEQAR
jgi:hypothetical protein